MKKAMIILTWLLLVVSSQAHPPQAPDGFRWEVVEELTDEFDGDNLDTTKWDGMHPHWSGRAPSQYKRENTFVKDGKLYLRSNVLKDPKTVENPFSDRWVSSAACVSKRNSAKAGYYYEASIKASDLSMSSSFWFRAGKFSEIDVIEHIGHPSNPISETLGKDLPYQYHANAFHYTGGSNTVQVNEDEWFMPMRGRDEYHVYGLWWKDPNVLLLYHNDVQVMNLPTPTPFNENLKMIFDTETFPDYYGPWGRLGLPKVENLQDKTKNTMYVDWVHTYKLVPDERTMACSGVVTCADTGRSLKDVQVKVLATERSILTDAQGRFYIFTDKPGPQTLVFDKPGFMVEEKTVTGVQNTIEMVLRPRRMSAASYRWLNYIESETAYNELDFRPNRFWRVEFKQSDLGGDFASDPRYVRRDPSAIIKVGDVYYVYYTKGTRYAEEGAGKKFFPWDQCDIWYATSKDGWAWQEQRLAVARGPAGTYDDASVFTVEVLAHEGRYYLVYQCVQTPYVYRVKNTVGMAVADSPDGPFTKLPEPILRPANNGQWAKEERQVIKKGDFDSHKVHDPCLMYYKNKFYLYYKGERMGEERFYGQREIRWGVAIADKPEGPYVKSEYNPITTSGHEVCVWHYNGGIALIHTADGPESHTIQWAPDGINFEIMGKIGSTPIAFGLYRTKNHDKNPLEGIRWGLCHTSAGSHWRTGWNYIKRFDQFKKK